MTGKKWRQLEIPIEQVLSTLQRWQRQTGAQELPTTVCLGVQHHNQALLLPLKTYLLKEMLSTLSGSGGYLRLDYCGVTGDAEDALKLFLGVQGQRDRNSVDVLELAI